MREYQSLSHTKWNCKYHVVFMPKRRKKVIFSKLRKHLGQLFHDLAKQKGCEIVEGISCLVTSTCASAYPQNMLFPMLLDF